jgi:hypothetical protein
MVKVGLWWREGKPETWLRIDKGDEVEPKEKLRTNCDGEAVVDANEGRGALRSNGVLERALKSDAMSVCRGWFAERSEMHFGEVERVKGVPELGRGGIEVA